NGIEQRIDVFHVDGRGERGNFQAHPVFQWKLRCDFDQFSFRKEPLGSQGQFISARGQPSNGEMAFLVGFKGPVDPRRLPDNRGGSVYAATGWVCNLKPQFAADPLAQCQGCAGKNRDKQKKEIPHPAVRTLSWKRRANHANVRVSRTASKEDRTRPSFAPVRGGCPS